MDGALERAPFAAEGGRTGAAFERVVLRDGTPVVVKHTSPDDLVPSIIGEADRQYRLWKSGVFARVPSVIDHAILTVERTDDGVIIVMHDRSKEFLGNDRVLTREESARVLRAVTKMHNGFWGETFDGEWSLAERVSAFANLGAGDWYLAPIWKRGWELFPDLVPSDVGEGILKVLAQPELLAAELSKARQTFVHGDLRLHNLGLSDDGVVLFDWEIAGSGVPAVDFAWYLIISATRIDAPREVIVEDYRRIAGDSFDARAWDLACLVALMSLGWNKALDIVDSTDPGHVAQERADLEWWVGRCREALNTWSPV